MTLDPLGEEGEMESEDSLDEDDVPEVKGPVIDTNKFEMLCDGVLNSIALVQASLAEFLSLKDELVQHALPPSLLARLAMVSGRIFRSTTDLHTPVTEMVRLVSVYSVSWEEKSAALKKLHSDYESKHKQLNIAVRRLQLIDGQAKRMARERRIMMWEKLFSKLTSARGHGRRWKFLIDNFKQKSKLGMEHLQAYIDSLDKEPDSDKEGGAGDEDEKDDKLKAEGHDLMSQSNSVNELQMLSSSDELEFSEDSSDDDDDEEDGQGPRRSSAGVKRVKFQDPAEKSDRPAPDDAPSPHHAEQQPKTVYVEVPAPKPPTSEKCIWTHEPEYDYYLNVKVYKPLGIQQSGVKCSITLEGQFMKSEVFEEDLPKSREKSGNVGGTPSSSRRSMIGTKGPPSSNVKKKKDLVKPDDKHHVLVFPLGRKPLFTSEEDAQSSHSTPLKQPLKVPLPPPKKSAMKKPKVEEDTEDEDYDDEDDDDGNKSVKSEVSEPQASTVQMVKLGIHHGPIDELVAMGSILREDMKAAEIPLKESIEETKDIYPTAFQVYALQTGRKANKTPDQPIGAIPLVFFYTRIHKPYVKDKQTSSETVNEIVYDMTGVDLKVMKKEDLSINKNYTDRCLSAKSIQSEPKEVEESVPKAEIDILVEQHNQEIQLLQEEYEARIQELVDALEQFQNEQLNTLLHPEPADKSGIEIKSPLHGWSPAGGDNKGETRLPDGTILPAPISKSDRKKLGAKWGNDLPRDFFERLKLFSEESQKRRDKLSERTKQEIKDTIEKQLAVQYKLSLPYETRKDALKDVSLPAVFMPSKTNQLYNPRAHHYFHPSGSLGQLRLTQPPSIFQLPPLPSKGHLSVLNLFDIRKNFNWEEREQPVRETEAGNTTATPNHFSSPHPPITPRSVFNVNPPPNTAEGL